MWRGPKKVSSISFQRIAPTGVLSTEKSTVFHHPNRQTNKCPQFLQILAPFLVSLPQLGQIPGFSAADASSNVTSSSVIGGFLNVASGDCSRGWDFLRRSSRSRDKPSCVSTSCSAAAEISLSIGMVRNNTMPRMRMGIAMSSATTNVRMLPNVASRDLNTMISMTP